MKAWKLIRNTLLALTGLVLVLLVALQILLRPSVLTGIVNRVTAGMVEGDIAFREVRAHVIKSFPFLNIDAKDFSLTYPHQRFACYDSLLTEPGRRMNLSRMGYGKDGAPDTLAGARVDLKGSARDVLGKDPLLSVSGRAPARREALRQEVVREQEKAAAHE